MAAVIIIGAVAAGAYLLGKSGRTITSLVAPDKETNRQIANTPVPSPTGQMLGGDRDEHGCIPSAGYSWCESKQKCYRPFEEGCPAANDSELIRQALFKKNNWPENNSIAVTISFNDGRYAKGTVASQGGGGYVFAAKVNGAWQIVTDGNGVISCSALTAFPDYPTTLIPECYDQSTGKEVKR